MNIKNYIKTLIVGAALVTSLTVNAQTEASQPIVTTQVEGKSEVLSVEFTLGGSGVTVNGESSGGLDFSLSTNPLDFAPNIWVGFVQGVYFEPDFAGSTDIFCDYSLHLIGDLYVNLGGFVGVVYDESTSYLRFGPEATLQYYVGENAFLYLGTNYDFVDDSDVDEGWRYSAGIGISF